MKQADRGERVPSSELTPRAAFDRALADCVVRLYGTALPKDHVDDVVESFLRLYPDQRAHPTGEPPE